jgi:hypothetical protein
MWGGLCCISLTFAYFLVPETKGLSLEQVDRMLEETSPRTSAKWVPHSTFAADMGLVNRSENKSGDEAAETVEVTNEKSMV